MSSSPAPNLGIISGATASASPLRQRVEEIEDQARSLISTLHGESELALAGAAVDTISVNNVIELDAPQARRVGPRSPALARPRINPRAVALVVHLADALVIAATGAVAYRLQSGFHWPIDPTVAFTALAMLAMLVRVPNAEPRLLHDSLRRPLSRRLADAALRTLLPFIGGIAVVFALVPAADAMQATLTHWLALWAMGAVAGVAGVRLCLSASIASWRSQGRLKEAVAIFGTGDLAERLLARLQASSPDAVELVGVFDDRARRRIASPGMRSLALGTADDLIALSRHRDIDRVVVALPHAAEQRVTQVLNKLRQMPVEISLAPDLIGFNVLCREPDGLAGLPLIEVYGRPLTFGQVLLKSAIDKTLAMLMLLVGAPLLLALAAAIKLDSRGPVLFRQNRYGFGDRVIGVYKFRTMCAEAADHNGVLCHVQNDPRVTRVGHFLRRWSLDELPQLINVLRGEMSLVGPRPHAISMQVEDRANHDIVPDYALRHHMKPGITGWAQVKGYHGPVATEEALRARVRYDLEYINTWSLWFDLQILARTVTTVLGQRHAF
jgi:Undecaprenyl-phosphate glucose phosphotransferase